jgi:hypothetical protein
MSRFIDAKIAERGGLPHYMPNVQPASAPTPLDLKASLAAVQAAWQLSPVLLVAQHHPFAPYELSRLPKGTPVLYEHAR